MIWVGFVLFLMRTTSKKNDDDDEKRKFNRSLRQPPYVNGVETEVAKAQEPALRQTGHSIPPLTADDFTRDPGLVQPSDLSHQLCSCRHHRCKNAYPCTLLQATLYLVVQSRHAGRGYVRGAPTTRALCTQSECSLVRGGPCQIAKNVCVPAPAQRALPTVRTRSW